MGLLYMDGFAINFSSHSRNYSVKRTNYDEISLIYDTKKHIFFQKVEGIRSIKIITSRVRP